MEKTDNIASFTQERREATYFGSVVFVVDDRSVDGKKRMFVIKELSDNKERKRKVGDLSVFCERRKPKENWIGNIRRDLLEETGLPSSRFDEIFDFSKRSIWETGFVKDVWATVAVVRCKNPELFSKLFGTEHEPDRVEAVGWMTLEEYENKTPLRDGVVNILSKFKDQIFDNEKINSH
jgi:hypothetical protein